MYKPGKKPKANGSAPGPVEESPGCSEIGGALDALGGNEATKPLADMLRKLLAASGVLPVSGAEEEPAALSHAQKVKNSLNQQRKASEKVIKFEKQQAYRKTRIESLQSQIDAVNVEFAQGKVDLETARSEADTTQELHRLLGFAQ